MKLETFRRLDNHDTRIRHLEANESGSEGSGGGTSPFTPVLKGETADPDIGDGIAVGIYTAAGQWVDAEFEFILGTGYSAGTGEWSVELPFVPAAVDDTPVGLVHLIDVTDETSATNRRVWALTSRTGENRVNIRGTADTTSRWASGTVPFTFAVGDRLIGQARFRVNVEIPQLAPTLVNVAQALESSNTTSHTISLSGGTADKIIVLCYLHGTPTHAAPDTPTGWTQIGTANFDNGGQFAFYYRENTSDTSVVITSAASARFGWYTADVVGGDLPGTLVSRCDSPDCGTSNTINPGALFGSTTSYLGIGAYSQWGAGISSVAPDTWPTNLPDNRLWQFNETGGNDARMAVATGGFVAVSTFDPGSLLWTPTLPATQSWMSIGIPSAPV